MKNDECIMHYSSNHLRIVYQDAALVVIDKPAGLLTVPLERRHTAPSAFEQLADYLRSHKRRPFVVHRIDRDTSGLVVFAKDARTQQQLKSQFERHQAERVYLALVHGRPQPASGIWRDHLAWDRDALIQRATNARDRHGKEAVSEYRIVKSLTGASLIEVRLHTGKRNQIRMQAGLHGHPLIGERRYTGPPQPLPAIEFPRQALHAHRVAFRHPRTRKPLEFEVPLPPDMTALVARLTSERGTPQGIG